MDIGQCALKALRCRAHESPKKVVAEAFDYIEYPKILSQPGSDPAEMIGDALKQFLSRNTVLGDRVAVSVSGQAGLARFIKLPPLEAKKIPDLVRYEARQQIPFDLNDVVWDYQRMGGGSVEEGFALDTEIGLFAMKRDAVFRALDPFLKLDIEVDIVQLTPLVLYNFLVFDQMGELPPPEEFDPENPPESAVIISMGTDATDLVITNGFRVWQRSIPIGGSHFTKALTRELKLTFAKAEHLKRNATAAADPKAVFQAMKPTFSDLLTELQRSIGYFSNLDRAAKIGRVVALGNAMKLPGLRRYLSQSLGYDIQKIDSFHSLEGAQVVGSPNFQENLLSFGVSYGLALQGLGKGAVHTNLLPREIVQSRLIKRKKPWAVAAAALVLLGCAVNYAARSLALGGVNDPAWQPAQRQAGELKRNVEKLGRGKSDADAKFTATDQVGKDLVNNVEGRIRWLELLKAIDACLPPAEEPKPIDEKAKDKEAARTNEIMQRPELHITNLDCLAVDDITAWKTATDAMRGKKADATAAATATAPAADPPADNPSNPSEATAAKGPTWIIQIAGHHFHNATLDNEGAEYVNNTLIKALREKTIELPTEDGKGKEVVSMKELGVSYPTIIKKSPLEECPLDDPNLDDSEGGGMIGPLGGHAAPSGDGSPAKVIKPLKFEFVVQFCWQPKTPAERRKAKEAAEKAKKAAQAANNTGQS
ncbi:MAG: pilus assembly protein PilM [Thermoguttaceae bacterium]